MQAVSLQHTDGTVQLTITDASLGQPQYFVFIYNETDHTPLQRCF